MKKKNEAKLTYGWFARQLIALQAWAYHEDRIDQYSPAFRGYTRPGAHELFVRAVSPYIPAGAGLYPGDNFVANFKKEYPFLSYPVEKGKITLI